MGLIKLDGLYSSVGTIDKSELWAQYAYLVRYEALKLHARLPAGVDIDDLIQVGAIAMLNAVEKFNPNLGIKISSYLAQKIRWAFMDELREYDWVPRRVRRTSREVSSAIVRVEQRTGRFASEVEVANEMGISLAEYQKILQETNTSIVCSLDELQDEAGCGSELPDVMDEELNPFNAILRTDLQHKISEAIHELPEREQLLLMLYYQNELNMKEIAIIFNVTETRVSQLHSQAIKRLRARLSILGLKGASEENPKINNAI